MAGLRSAGPMLWALQVNSWVMMLVFGGEQHQHTYIMCQHSERVLRFLGELHEEDLLANDSSVVVVTSAGYIKRMPLEEFTAQNRFVILQLALWFVDLVGCWPSFLVLLVPVYVCSY